MTSTFLNCEHRCLCPIATFDPVALCVCTSRGCEQWVVFTGGVKVKGEGQAELEDVFATLATAAPEWDAAAAYAVAHAWFVIKRYGQRRGLTA